MSGSPATTDFVPAVGSAPGKGGHAASRQRPEGITTTERGTGTNTRFIGSIAMEDRDACGSLLVTEVFAPAGHWSRYPSNRHDADDFPRITDLDETYQDWIAPADGFGIQRVYTEDGRLDETSDVRDGDVDLVPRGHQAASPVLCHSGCGALPARSVLCGVLGALASPGRCRATRCKQLHGRGRIDPKLPGCRSGAQGICADRGAGPGSWLEMKGNRWR